MLLTLTVTLFVYIVSIMVGLACYFSSWEVMTRFLVCLIPMVLGFILNYRSLIFGVFDQYTRSFLLYLITSSILFTLGGYCAIDQNSPDMILNNLPDIYQFMERVFEPLKKVLSYFGIKFE